MSISFRTRLFVVAALIVASVLAVVLGFGWSRVRDVEAERLDERLCQEARRVATQPVAGDRLRELEADVALKLRLGAPEQLRLRADSADGHNVFQSAGWPQSAAPERLAWRPAPRGGAAGTPPRGPREGLGEGPGDGRMDERRPDRGPDRREGRPDRPGRPGPPPGWCSLSAFQHQGDDWHAARFELPFRGAVSVSVPASVPVAVTVVAASLASVKADMQAAVRQALTVIVPVALLFSALGAWLLSSLTMRPVNRLRQAMRGVTQGALDQRLPSVGEDREFKDLIAEYNTMLGRLESSFHQASRFSADAAHELKTPLTILQGRLEQAIGRSENRAIQADLGGMLEEVASLSSITRKLLLLAQADAGRLALQRSAVDLTALLDALLSDAQMLLDGQGLAGHIEPGLTVEGDPLLLRQLFNNLVSNAVHHGLPGGLIEVHARARPGGVEVEFVNPSAPISAEQRARFFERFFRVGAAAETTSSDQPPPRQGSGLGLSLAREIARAHGGELNLQPVALQADSMHAVRLRLWLPLAPPPALAQRHPA